MLTLQNEPPTLDSGAEDKEQYKAFGNFNIFLGSYLISQKNSKNQSKIVTSWNKIVFYQKANTAICPFSPQSV